MHEAPAAHEPSTVPRMSRFAIDPASAVVSNSLSPSPATP